MHSPDTKAPALAIWALGLTQIVGYGTLFYSFSVLAPAMAQEFAPADAPIHETVDEVIFDLAPVTPDDVESPVILTHGFSPLPLRFSRTSREIKLRPCYLKRETALQDCSMRLYTVYHLFAAALPAARADCSPCSRVLPFPGMKQKSVQLHVGRLAATGRCGRECDRRGSKAPGTRACRNRRAVSGTVSG